MQTYQYNGYQRLGNVEHRILYIRKIQIFAGNLACDLYISNSFLLDREGQL